MKCDRANPGLVFFWLLLMGAMLFATSCNRDERRTVSDGGDRQEPRRPRLVETGGNQRAAAKVRIEYPLDGAMFPLEIAPATVVWKDDASAADTWLVRVGHPGEPPVVETQVTEQHWKASRNEWASMLRSALERPLIISISGTTHSNAAKLLSGAEVSIRASSDPVGAPIFFREVPLPFDYANRYPEKIRYRLGYVSDQQESKVLLENLPLCGNCHSFSKDGKTLGMDVDYANDKGSYVITELEKLTALTPDKIITWSDANKGDDTLTFGLLSQLSPDGRTAVSTVKDRSIFVGLEENLAYSQLFFPIQGILAVYDRDEGSFAPLHGADDPNYVQSNPAWSPDGKTLLFARAKAYRSQKTAGQKSVVLPREAAAEFLTGGKKFKYDIFKIPFEGGAGGEPVPLEGASHNGKSNYFPKVTPDGKWVVFVQAESFMLLQPDSKLYIVPAEGGDPREMTCNTSAMNSWHSFSPNGRWMVFSSKERGPYTQLWLTHLDEQGNDTPAVVLDHLSTPKRAANIPEFLNIATDSLQQLTDQFSEGGNYHYRIAKNLLRYGDLTGALESLDRAVSKQPNDVEVFLERGALRFRMKKKDLALRDFERAAAIAPDDFRGPYNLGLAKEALGDLSGAHDALSRAAGLNPKSFDVWFKKASLRLKLEGSKGALEDVERALALNPKSVELLETRSRLRGSINAH
jgi:tetratricopeptide (TPR) repeat protein